MPLTFRTKLLIERVRPWACGLLSVALISQIDGIATASMSLLVSASAELHDLGVRSGAQDRYREAVVRVTGAPAWAFAWLKGVGNDAIRRGEQQLGVPILNPADSPFSPSWRTALPKGIEDLGKRPDDAERIERAKRFFDLNSVGVREGRTRAPRH